VAQPDRLREKRRLCRTRCRDGGVEIHNLERMAVNSTAPPAGLNNGDHAVFTDQDGTA